jgi:hypothetical protein
MARRPPPVPHEISYWKKFKTLVENNPNTSQLIVNSILIVVTVITVIVTAFFSNQGILESQKQYSLAESNLKLAKDQFHTTLIQRMDDSLNGVRKHKSDSLKARADSISMAEKYNAEQNRYVHQEKLNNKQMLAIQLQANTAREQYNAQKSINDVQNNQNKPILFLFETHYDTTRSIAVFSFKNVGKRKAEIYTSAMCSVNIEHLKFNPFLDAISNNQLNESITTGLELPCSKWDYDSSKTLYYVAFYYIDPAYDKPQKFFKYFTWYRNIDKSVLWSDLKPEYVDMLQRLARINKFIYEKR